ncbi:uncharacterized protein EAF01_001615 [Botrytis porri]|uniref:uncharacterized protein n=1 Tax=Botrytis porri TaxID=87229 RepID=UPI0019015AB7|nr:uncharacterized protein EAF01_001615 [Botrytis porri]KAF7912594.1 hypothetical protein EAF01_001615 [Botrytis porri]
MKSMKPMKPTTSPVSHQANELLLRAHSRLIRTLRIMIGSHTIGNRRDLENLFFGCWETIGSWG